MTDCNCAARFYSSDTPNAHQGCCATRQAGHPCPIDGCTKSAKDGQLMCLQHWRRVPRVLNHAVFDTYRNIRSDPASYRSARDAAIAAVNQKMKDQAACATSNPS